MLSVRVPSCEMLCGKRGAECPAARIRPTENEFSAVALYSPHHASGIERRGGTKRPNRVYSGFKRSQRDIKGKARELYI